MLRVTFGSQREKVAGNSRKLYHKKLRDFEYVSSDQIKDNEMGGERPSKAKKRDECRVLAERRMEKNHLEDPDVDENNIKVHLQEIVVMAWS